MILAGATVNQTPLDWKENIKNLLEAIEEAKSKKVDILCLPELSICGYGCQDLFLSEWLWKYCVELLFNEVIPNTENILVSVGLPVKFEGELYNCTALIHNKELICFIPKQNLANDGVHYEPRWFKAWPVNKTATLQLNQGNFSIGDHTYEKGTYKIGFEICEDAWKEDRPACRLMERGVNLILNPSASHFALAKSMSRQHLVIDSSKNFNCTYIYANLLGNETGRMIYDGEIMIAKEGELLKHNELLSFKNFNLVTWNDEDDKTFLTKRPTDKNIEFHKAASLALFDYLRKAKSNGYVLSLSGGADSSTCAILVSEMISRGIDELGLKLFLQKIHKADWFDQINRADKPKKAIANRIFTTAYQGTINSGEATLNSARELAAETGAIFHHWMIDEEVKSYTQTIENCLGRKLSWEKDDIALQNIQARARSPIIWMLANIKNALLITTSNRSEGSVGYTTMDGDTSGSIAPIAAIDKPFIINWLKWAEKSLGYKSLKYVNSLQPTAELRPSSNKQTDETDLMPYPILQAIENLAINHKKSPVEVYLSLKQELQLEKENLKKHILKFYRLWSRNQWKRERIAPSFHLDDYNVDPKTWYRFPILSGAFTEELKALENID
jgi:NAD+ synthase (glutamine-hydrolysing)